MEFAMARSPQEMADVIAKFQPIVQELKEFSDLKEAAKSFREFNLDLQAMSQGPEAEKELKRRREWDEIFKKGTDFAKASGGVFDAPSARAALEAKWAREDEKSADSKSTPDATRRQLTDLERMGFIFSGMGGSGDPANQTATNTKRTADLLAKIDSKSGTLTRI
jgi:hypothetical protein